MSQRITWDPEKLERFKREYHRQIMRGRTRHDVFEFENVEFVMAYAGVLIEYLEKKFSTL